MYLNYGNGTLNTSNYKHWSESAIMCYERGCKCENCYIKDILSTKCMMKYSVINLVKKLGKPFMTENPFFKGITLAEEKVIKAILNGCETKEDISLELNTEPHNVQRYLEGLYSLAALNGAKFKRIKFKLPELVKFIKQQAKEKGLKKAR